jgi:hypothetical protein
LHFTLFQDLPDLHGQSCKGKGLGDEVMTHVEGAAGTNQAQWDAGGLAAGVYLAVVEVTGPSGFVGRQILKFAVVP